MVSPYGFKQFWPNADAYPRLILEGMSVQVYAVEKGTAAVTAAAAMQMQTTILVNVPLWWVRTGVMVGTGPAGADVAKRAGTVTR